MAALLARDEHTNRAVKASKLADLLAEHGVTAHDVPGLPDSVWALVLSLGAERGVLSASSAARLPSTATRCVVAALLAQRAATGPVDVFAAFAGAS